MQASKLYVGEYYAYARYPVKGGFTRGASKVRVRGLEQHKGRYDTNAKTTVLITFVETGKEGSVPARKILDFWDDYQRELRMLEREEEQREQNRHRSRVRDEMINLMLSQRFHAKTGMDLTGRLEYQPYGKTVVIPSAPLLTWLGITEEDIENQVDAYIAGGG